MEVNQIGKKLILITGCNKGVGYGIFKNLASRPDNHSFIMAVRSAERGKAALEELEKTIPKLSERTIIQELDVSKTESVDKFVQWVKDSGNKIDCLINNAGMALKGDTFNEDKEKLTAAMVEETFQLNFYGTINFTEKVLPYIVDSGKIVTITSGLGRLFKLTSDELKKKFDNAKITREELFALAKQYHDDVADRSFDTKGWPKQCYPISKLFLNVYMRILGKNEEVVKRGIQVCGCCPGYVRTDATGPDAPRSIDEGSVCPCDMVYLPWKINPEWQGGFFSDSVLTAL